MFVINNHCMTIKRLVIAGGGHLGLKYLGILSKLHDEKFWDIQDINAIYGTSAGALVGVLLCLKHDWDMLYPYIINRPWHDVFKVNIKLLFELFHKKGIYDETITAKVLSPLLKSKDLDTNITLKELYEYSSIDLHIFTSDLNSFSILEMSHSTHPDLQVVVALTMSCAIPGVFMPTFIDSGCYIDGGLLNNYPLKYCIRDDNTIDNILGINCYSPSHVNKNSIITTESSLLEYIVSLAINSMNFISNANKPDIITNEINVNIDCDTFSIKSVTQFINDATYRSALIADGNKIAQEFLNKQTQLQSSALNNSV